MSTEENVDKKSPASESATDKNSSEASSAAEGEAVGEKEEDRSTRMNAAKAFYRAMYAGEDVVPDDFGMNLERSRSAPNDHLGPCANCARLEAQVAEALAKKDEIDGLYKRLAADWENFRKRIEREREEFQSFGMQKGIEAILPALDDLDRARTSLANVTDPKALLDSLNLVANRFTRCLEGMGIKPLEVVGEHFDPRFHEPVQQIETNEFADGVVMAELRRGYSFKDKTLRPALVNVADNATGVVVPKEPKEPKESGPDADKDAEAKGAPEPQEESKAAAPESAKEEVKETAEKPAEAPKSTDLSAVDPVKEEKPEAKTEATAETKTPEEAKTAPAERPDDDKPTKRLMGGSKSKRASNEVGDKKFDPTITADLPVLKFDESESLMPTIDDDDDDQTSANNEQSRRYDITDAVE